MRYKPLLFLSMLALAPFFAHAATSVTLTAQPPLVGAGNNTTLTWTSQNASTCVGTGFIAATTNGSVVVQPTAAQTYSINCDGVIASTTVIVENRIPTPPSTSGSTSTILVGPQRTYTKPSQAFAVAHDGDTIIIDFGTYIDDFAVIVANNLTIKTAGGRVQIKQTATTSPNGKAIWVVQGRNTTINGIEFTGARSLDNNGAGIRAEGAGLTLRNTLFDGNQNGILAADNALSDILIESSEFLGNGAGDGQTHNIYIGHVRSFTLRYSYSHYGIVGHLVKTRALQNFIMYNRLTGEQGTESYEVDVPNGGETYIVGNMIEQGANSQNSAIMAYGEEGAPNPVQKLYVINNTLVNDKSGGTFIWVSGAPTVQITNNLFAGTGTLVSGATLNTGNVTTVTPGFVNQSAYDYHLTASSPAVDHGSNPGFTDLQSLAPTQEYAHPLFHVARVQIGQYDAGAYEFNPVVTTPTPVSSSPAVTLTASPATILAGQGAQLNWTSTNTTSCTGTGFAAPGTFGTVYVVPQTTYTYTVTCGGFTAQATVTVQSTSTNTQTSNQATSTLGIGSLVAVIPSVGYLLASPSQNAQWVDLVYQNATGTIVDGPVTAENATWWKVQIGTSAYGGPGKTGWLMNGDLASLTINTPSNPIVTISVSPSIILAGQQAVLYWSSAGSSLCQGNLFAVLNTTGSLAVTPQQTTTYTITCGSATASATVVVSNPSGDSTQPQQTGTQGNAGAPQSIVGVRTQAITQLNVRSNPSISAQLECKQSQGSLGTVVTGPVNADGHDWILINYDQGCDGWSAEEYLIPVQGNQTTTPAPSPAPATSGHVFTRSLSVGMSGDDVAALQTILQTKGYFNNAVTGYFGNITKAALAKFQSDNYLEPVGSVGPKTRAILNSL